MVMWKGREGVLEMTRRAWEGMSLLDKGEEALRNSGAVTSSLTQKIPHKSLPCPAGHAGVKVLWSAGGIHRQNQ